MTPCRALLIGYGNPARCDDGLGPAFASRIAERNLQDLRTVTEFQRVVEHAALIAEHELVIFADAHIEGIEPFHFAELEQCEPENLGSHSVTPEAALALAKLLYNVTPRAFMLGICGSQFGSIEERLSDRALSNLSLAESFFLGWYEDLARHRAWMVRCESVQKQN